MMYILKFVFVLWGPLLPFWYCWKALDKVMCVFVISQFLDWWNKSYYIGFRMIFALKINYKHLNDISHNYVFFGKSCFLEIWKTFFGNLYPLDEFHCFCNFIHVVEYHVWSISCRQYVSLIPSTWSFCSMLFNV